MTKEKLSDQWQTPQWLFNQLNEEFNFNIDLCATRENSKCKLWYNDYLNNDVEGEELGSFLKGRYFTNNHMCFMNPPYSNPKPFIEKAWEDSKHCKIVCLVKCDPSTKWWSTFWDYNIRKTRINKNKDKHVICAGEWVEFYIYNGPKPGCEVRFFPKRIKFDPPQELINRGEVVLSNKKWFIKCTCFNEPDWCEKCTPYRWKELSGPSFSSALIIMDRRGL